MQSLRQAHHIARCVLLWFVLSIGVAIASPLVHPQDLQLVCSGSGSLKLVVGSANDKAGGTQSHTLDCPLCTGLGAAPPLDTVFFSAAAPQSHALPLNSAGPQPAQASAAPAPARGPPLA